MYLSFQQRVKFYAERTLFVILMCASMVAVISFATGCAMNFGGGGKAPTRSSVRYNHQSDGAGLNALGSAFKVESKVAYDLCMDNAEFDQLGSRPPAWIILRLKFKRGDIYAVYAHPDVADDNFDINPTHASKCAPMGNVATEGMPHKSYPFFYQLEPGSDPTKIAYKLVPVAFGQKQKRG